MRVPGWVAGYSAPLQLGGPLDTREPAPSPGRMGCLAMVPAGFRFPFPLGALLSLPLPFVSRIVGLNPPRVMTRTLRVSHTAAAFECYVLVRGPRCP